MGAPTGAGWAGVPGRRRLRDRDVPREYIGSALAVCASELGNWLWRCLLAFAMFSLRPSRLFVCICGGIAECCLGGSEGAFDALRTTVSELRVWCFVGFSWEDAQ